MNLSTLFRRKHSASAVFELTLEEKLSLWKLRLPPQFPCFSTAFGCGSKPLKIAHFNPVTEHFSVPHKPQFYCEKRCFWQSGWIFRMMKNVFLHDVTSSRRNELKNTCNSRPKIVITYTSVGCFNKTSQPRSSLLVSLFWNINAAVSSPSTDDLWPLYPSQTVVCQKLLMKFIRFSSSTRQTWLISLSGHKFQIFVNGM